MKILNYVFFLLFTPLSIFGQVKTDEQQRDVAFYNATNKWFSAWKLVSKDIYQIDKVKPVDFVFFDDNYVYSTSSVAIRNGISVKGCNLLNLKLKWKKALHHDTLTLPDKSVVPIRLMSFAAKIPNESNKSFFVMPLPSFWEKSGTTSKELGLENLITGVFIHEFSHSQQMQNFVKEISKYEKQNNLGAEFSDNLIQNLFDKDTNYLIGYNKEVELFYSSIKNNRLDKQMVREGIALLRKRQKEYFLGDMKHLNNLDDLFITMEGLGQYSIYVWLTHPNGGNISNDVAIRGIRRNRKSWSQDEGFVLFLILDQLTKPKIWAKDMFGDKAESVIVLIDKLVK